MTAIWLSILRTVIEIKLPGLDSLHRIGKARRAEHTEVCDRRVTQLGRMQRVQRVQGDSFIMVTVLSAGLILSYPGSGHCVSADAPMPAPDTTPDEIHSPASESDTGQSSEITSYDPGNPEKMPSSEEVLSEDPLDADETSATMAAIGVSQAETDAAMGSSLDADVDADIDANADAAMADLLEQLKPYGKGDMELAAGLGGTTVGFGDAFRLSVSAVFAYYVINRLAPGIEMDYAVTFGDVKYPQNLTFFPFIKYVLIRSPRFAPYLLAGGGRTMEWGGATRPVNTGTGEINGFPAVSSWVLGMGGGVMIGIGSRAHLQLQLLAMRRAYDEEIWREIKVVRIEALDAAGNPVITFRAAGERTDRLWYPSPSIWFSFAL